MANAVNLNAIQEELINVLEVAGFAAYGAREDTQEGVIVGLPTQVDYTAGHQGATIEWPITVLVSSASFADAQRTLNDRVSWGISSGSVINVLRSQSNTGHSYRALQVDRVEGFAQFVALPGAPIGCYVVVNIVA